MKLVPTSRGLAGFSARHPWKVLGVWVLIIVAAALLTSVLGKSLDTNGDFTNNPDSKQANTLLEDKLWGKPQLSDTVVIRSQQYTVDDPAFQAIVAQTAADLTAETGAVRQRHRLLQATAAGDAGADKLVSADVTRPSCRCTIVGTRRRQSLGEEYVAIAQGAAQRTSRSTPSAISAATTPTARSPTKTWQVGEGRAAGRADRADRRLRRAGRGRRCRSCSGSSRSSSRSGLTAHRPATTLVSSR